MSVIFLFFCVIFVTTILFGGWMIITIARFIGRAFGASHRPYFAGAGSQCCANPGCRTINPIHAHYCRRCGSDLTNPATTARRAAQRPPQYNAATGNERRMANV